MKKLLYITSYKVVYEINSDGELVISFGSTVGLTQPTIVNLIQVFGNYLLDEGFVEKTVDGYIFCT
jgi:hypothetical protein